MHLLAKHRKDSRELFGELAEQVALNKLLKRPMKINSEEFLSSFNGHTSGEHSSFMFDFFLWTSVLRQCCQSPKDIV